MDTTAPEHSQRITLYKYINELANKWPHTYLALTCLFALTGYIFVLLLPMLAIVAGINIYEILLADNPVDWQGVSIWFAVLIISSMLCYRNIQLKPAPPTGLILSEKIAPEIFILLKQLHTHFKRPSIQRIIITADYELDVIKVPKWALPVWSMNTLVIGLPVLLCHSPKQFECMVARRLGQFSKQNNPLLNWLYQLRAIWPQYSLAYGKQKYPDSKLLKWFYAAYSYLYLAVSVFAARKDELNADSYATEAYNDADVREMITANAVYQWHLHRSFWPAVNKIASVKTRTPLSPYQKIASNIHANLKGDKLATVLDEVFNATPHATCPVPSLRSRLENIGHDTPAMSVDSGTVAATHYLGASLKGVIDLFDKLWLKHHIENQKSA